MIKHTASMGFVLSLLLLSMPVEAKKEHKDLPPGLQKRVESGKPLPPGWQRKLAVGDILSDDVYRRGRVVKRERDEGLVTITVEGKLIRLIENTREIVEILDSL